MRARSIIRSVIPVLILSVFTFLTVPSAAVACSRCVCEFQTCHCEFSLFFFCFIGPSEDACTEYTCGGGPQGELRNEDPATSVAQATETDVTRTDTIVKRQVVHAEELPPRT